MFFRELDSGRGRGLLATLALLSALTACEQGTEPRADYSRCQQTYEFGNRGCADIKGYVTNGSGQGLAGFKVRVVGSECCLGGGTTSSAGSYALRVFWFDPDHPETGFVADTATLWIRASRRPNSPSDTIVRRDSVSVFVQFSAVGDLAKAHWVDFQFPW